MEVVPTKSTALMSEFNIDASGDDDADSFLQATIAGIAELARTEGAGSLEIDEEDVEVVPTKSTAVMSEFNIDASGDDDADSFLQATIAGIAELARTEGAGPLEIDEEDMEVVPTKSTAVMSEFNIDASGDDDADSFLQATIAGIAELVRTEGSGPLHIDEE